ncbi:MAG: aspartate/glutamate racemase family protein [Burkholderiales bacterium]
MQTPSMKIYWPIGLTREMPGRTGQGEMLENSLAAYAQSVVSPGTAVTIGWMRKTTSLLSSTFLGMLNDVHVIGDILQAQREGFDAAMIGPHWDPGLYGAREAASIPVAGPLEAAVMVAQTLGRRFAVLTVHEGYVPMIERNLRLYGCESRAIANRPVRRFGMTYENIVAALGGTSDAFLAEFTKTANECIADGADVIIAGGQLFGPVFQRYRYFTVPDTGVPVVEVAACGLKMAETLVSLKRSIGLVKSEHPNAPFRTPAADALAQARASFGVG